VWTLKAEAEERGEAKEVKERLGDCESGAVDSQER